MVKLRRFLEHTAQTLIDSAMSLVPRYVPPLEKLRNAKLIAHRGLGPGIIENTLDAFQAALDSHVWGIEFDVRFTKDDVPLVHHDVNLKRVHGVKLNLEKSTFDKVRASAPLVPTLQEVVERFGGRIHLMMEIKKRRKGFSREQIEAVEKVFSALKPIRDYHIMALSTSTLEAFAWVPRAACLTISTTNSVRMNSLSLKRGYGGHTGYYVLVTDKMIQTNNRRKLVTGTGFIVSKNILYREINRGVELLYTNYSSQFQTLIDQLIKEATPKPN